MKVAVRMSGDQRREGIIKAVRSVFVEKGFHGTTTRELAQAAGVSEALLFKHFPSKEALYLAIQHSCFKRDGAEIAKRLDALEPSTESLVFLVHHLVSHMLGERVPDDDECSFVRLLLRSLMDEGEFARSAIKKGPAHWVRKFGQCAEAAIAAGDAEPGPVRPDAAAWFINQMVAMVMIHLLPREPVLDFGVSREQVIEQAVWFSLRGMGLKDAAIRRCFNPAAVAAWDAAHQTAVGQAMPDAIDGSCQAQPDLRVAGEDVKCP
jgi:AcrR family transcriptional regulator